MRRVDKELKRVSRTLKQLEDCICTPLCKEGGIIPLSGNGCRAKVRCNHLDRHFANNYDKLLLIGEQRSYLRQKKDTLRAYH